jgi:hypothetical protein
LAIFTHNLWVMASPDFSQVAKVAGNWPRRDF